MPIDPNRLDACQAALDHLLKRVDSFDESKHPRASDGKFGSGGAFTRDTTKWEYGSGAVPKGSIWETSPLPMVEDKNNPQVVLGPMRSEAVERNGKPETVRIKDLKVWQGDIDPDKLRPLDEGYPPINVYKINGEYVVGNGNHRAVSGWVEGKETIEANVVDMNDPKNKRYWKRGLFPG